MKKYSRILSLFLVVSMLFGFTGCASLVKLPKTTENDTKISSTESGKKDSITSNKSTKDSKQEQAQDTVEEPLMSELFTGKLELLEYLIELYYMNEVSTEELQTGVYKGLLQGLGDPYSCYYTAEEYNDMMESATVYIVVLVQLFSKM